MRATIANMRRGTPRQAAFLAFCPAVAYCWSMTTPVYPVGSSPVVFPAPRTRATHRSGRHDLAIFFAWLISLITLAIWVHGGGLLPFTRGPSSAVFQAIGGLLGFLAALAFVFQLLLMARIPFFEFGFGRDHIVYWHRKFGFWSFWLVLAHFISMGIGYMGSGTVFSSLRNILIPRRVDGFPFLTWDWPGLGPAVIGTLLVFLAVILLSVAKVRHKMKYEGWHLWHLMAYPGVLLMIPHMILSGSSFRGNRPAQVFWWVLWAATVLTLVIYRVLMPIIRSARHDVRVAEVVPDGNRGITVKMVGRNLDQLHARGGSFFTWRFVESERPIAMATAAIALALLAALAFILRLGTVGAVAHFATPFAILFAVAAALLGIIALATANRESLRGHPISLAMPPTDNTLQIAVRVVGDGTKHMAQMQPGTRVIFEGPMGRVNGDLRLGHRLLMFGAGAGVGPMMAILGEQDWAPGEAVLVSRDNTPEETMMLPEIQHLIDTRGLIWVRETGGLANGGSMWLPPGPDGMAPDGAALIQSWLGTDPLYDPSLGGSYTNTDVFVCGPPPWMTAVKKDLDRAGVAPEQIHIEEFAY